MESTSIVRSDCSGARQRRCRASSGRPWTTIVCGYIIAFWITAQTAVALTAYSREVQNYLTNYGYLPKSDLETGNLRSESHLIEAIRTLQRFGNVPETGRIDEATAALLKRPRCGQPDQPRTNDFSADNRFDNYRRRWKRYAIQGSKWQNTKLKWSFVNTTMENATQVRRVLTDALAIWARSSKLTFREVYSEDADIQVMFARGDHSDGYNFDGAGGVLAHAFFPGGGRGGDAHFDAEEKWLLWNNKKEKGTSLMGVAVHEFGHSLGLGHSSVENSIMFPWYSNYENDKELPDDDRIAIQQIYGIPSKQWDINPHRRTPPTTTTTAKTTTTTTTTTTTPRSYYPDRTNHNPRRRPESNDRPTRPNNDYPDRPTHNHPNRDNPTEHHPPHYPDYPRHNHPTHHHDHPHVPPTRRYYPTYTRHHHTTTAAPTTERPRPVIPPKPDACNMDYDAITIIRGELFIFKDRYHWRFNRRGDMYGGYPYEISRMWSGLPSNFTHIDTVYEDNKTLKILFFIGNMYYSFDSNMLEFGYPKRLTHLGLPASLDHLDAALIWGHNNRTFFFSGDRYWRFDDETRTTELDYPRSMNIWRGIGFHINTAFQHQDGKTYFFKNRGFWQFDDSIMSVGQDRPLPAAQRWMKCGTHPDREDADDEYYETDDNETMDGQPPTKRSSLHSGTTRIHTSSTILALILALMCYPLVWRR